MEISIRQENPDDFEALWHIYQCPGVIHGTLQMPYPSQELWKKRLSEPAEHRFGLLAEVEGRVVGHLVLFRKMNSPRMMHVGGIGMGVHDDFQGKGVGSALMQEAVRIADHWLGLIRLELTVYVDNAPAIALYTKFGFEFEGCQRASALRAGRYIDVDMMGRLHPNPPSVADAVTKESVTPASLSNPATETH